MIACFLYLLFELNFLTGTVLSKQTGNVIPYATISIKEQNIGVVANERGEFTFDISNHQNDTLLISALGFEKLHFPINEIEFSPREFHLVQRAEKLKEVWVSNQKCRKNQLGITSNRPDGRFDRQDFGKSPLNYQTCLLLLPPNNDELYFIQSVSYFLRHSSVRDKPARVRIYDFDTITGQPVTDLLMNNYLIKPESTFSINPWGKWSRVNIEEEFITIPAHGIIVCYEWLINEDGGPVLGLIAEKDSNLKSFRKDYNKWHLVENNRIELNNGDIITVLPMIRIETKSCDQ